MLRLLSSVALSTVQSAYLQAPLLPTQSVDIDGTLPKVVRLDECSQTKETKTMSPKDWISALSLSLLTVGFLGVTRVIKWPDQNSKDSLERDFNDME